jgi:hypothetical protein
VRTLNGVPFPFSSGPVPTNYDPRGHLTSTCRPREYVYKKFGADIDLYVRLCLFIHFFKVVNSSFGEP